MSLLYFMLQAKDRELENKVDLKSEERGGRCLQDDHCQPRGSDHAETWKWNKQLKTLKDCKMTIFNHEALTMLRHGNGTSN